MSTAELSSITDTRPDAVESCSGRPRGEGAGVEPDGMVAWLDQVGAPVVVLDPQGQVLLLNGAGAAALGRVQEEVHGRSAWELELVFESAARFHEVWEQVAAGGQSSLTISAPDPFEEHAQPFTWSCAGMRKGEDALTHLVCTRIGSAEGVEPNSVRGELGRFRAVLDGTTDFVGITDAQGTPIYLNPAGRRLIGEERARAATRVDFADYHPAWTAKLLEETALPTARREGSWVGEAGILNAEGCEVPVSMVVLAHRDARGEVCSFSCIVRDLTEHKREEAALRESRGKLDAMLRSIPDHMSMMDRDLNVLWANEAARRLFGSDIVGKKCYEAFHGRSEPCEPYPCITLQTLRDGLIHEHETEVSTREGARRRFHCTANVALTDEQGNPTAVLEVSRDVTEQQRLLEATRRQRDLAVRLAAAGSLDEGLSLALDTAVELAGLDCGGVYLFEEGTGDLVLKAYRGVSEEFVAVVGRRAADSKNVRLVRRGEPIYTQRRNLELVLTDAEAREGVQAFALIPLRHKDEIIGCLIAGSHRTEEIAAVGRLMLETVAAQIGGAVERLKMQDLLRASERNYRTLFDASSVMLFVYDPTGGAIDDVNDEVLRVLGYTKEEIRELNIGSLSLDEAPFTQAEGERLIQKAISDGAINVEWCLKKKTGELVWTENAVKRVTIGGRELVLCAAVDISAHKQAEERLRLLVAAVEQSTEGIAVTDPTGHVLFVNRAFAEAHGHAPDELAGKPLSVFHTPGQMAAVEAANRQLRATGRFAGEVEHVRKDGTTFVASMHNSVVRNESGEIIALAATVRDVTEQKQAEAVLLRLQNAVEQSIDGIAVVDSDGVIDFVNPAWARMHGYGVEDLLGKHLSMFHTPAQLERDVLPCLKRARKLGAHQQEIGHVHADGTLFPTWMSVSGLTDAAGKQVGIVGIARDVTEQHRVQAALRESERRFAAFMDHFPGVAFIMDAQQRPVFANQRLCTIYGLKQEELLQRNFADLFPKDQLAHAVEQDRRVLAEGRTVVSEEVLPELTGSTRWLVYKFPIRREGRDTLIGGMAIDITQRKQMEEALRQAEQEKELILRSVSELVVYLGKDLRIKWANQAAGDSLGMCPRDLRGRYCHEVWQRRSTPCADCSVVQALQTGRAHEHEISTPEGRHWQVRAYPVRDDGGQVTGVVEVSQDVTERKRVEDLLAKERETLNSVIDRNPLSIVLLDGEGMFLRVNRAGRELFKSEPPPGYCLFEDPVLLRAGQGDNLERLRGGEAVEFPPLWYNPNEVAGDVPDIRALVRARAFPILDRAGEPELIVVMHEDVTEQDRAEQALRQSEQRYREFIEGTDDLVTQVDRNGILTFINHKAVDIFGLTPEQCVGRAAFDFVHPDDKEATRAALR